MSSNELTSSNNIVRGTSAPIYATFSITYGSNSPVTLINRISNEGRDVIGNVIAGRIRKELPNILNTPKRSKTNLRKPTRAEWRRIVNV